MNRPTPVALVTGAGSGIGRATCIALAGAGYRLAIVGRSIERLQATRSLTPNTDVHCLPADLEDPAQVEGMVDAALAHFGRIDALINNAGWSPAATIPQTTPEVAQRVFALNALAPCIAISRVWPILERQARAGEAPGVIVNVSSLASVDPFPTLYAYGAAKAGMNNLARSVATLGQPLGIRGYAVAPGAVETELLRSIVDEKTLPATKTLRPEAVAEIILSCVRGDRDRESGSTIFIPSP